MPRKPTNTDTQRTPRTRRATPAPGEHGAQTARTTRAARTPKSDGVEAPSRKARATASRAHDLYHSDTAHAPHVYARSASAQHADQWSEAHAPDAHTETHGGAAVPRRPPTPSRPSTPDSPAYIAEHPSEETTETPAPRWLARTLTLLAYGIPLAFLAYVLYINYLPFGYERTFTIDVGAEGDTDSRKAFYLQPSPDLSAPKVAPDGTTYRELNGIAYAVFKPPVVLRDAEITVTVEGDEGVSIIPPVIDFDPDEHEWDYVWDFTKQETAFTPQVSERALADWLRCSTSTEEIAKWLDQGGTIIGDFDLQALEMTLGTSTDSTPEAGSAIASPAPSEICVQLPVPDLVGNAFWFDGGMYFDGNSRLEMPGTADMFEDGPFTVYVEWVPEESSNNFQQLVGRYSWEIYQNSNGTEFRIGRLNDDNRSFLSTKSTNFYNNSNNTLVAVYFPNTIQKNGFFDSYLNGNSTGRTPIGDSVFLEGYSAERVLSLGKGDHGSANFFKGKIYNVRISQEELISKKNNISLLVVDHQALEMLLMSNQAKKIESINLELIN